MPGPHAAEEITGSSTAGMGPACFHRAPAANSDPTRPIIFSFRNEFYDLEQGDWILKSVFYRTRD